MNLKRWWTVYLLGCWLVPVVLSASQTVREHFETGTLHPGLTVREGAAARIENDTLYLRSDAGGYRATALQSAGHVPNADYSFALEFFPEAENQDGYAFQIDHRDEKDEVSLWYVELVTHGQAAVYRTLDGAWQLVAMAPDITFDTWYRLVVENRPDAADIRLTERDTGRVLFDLANVRHDSLDGGRLRVVPNAVGAKQKPRMAMRIDVFDLELKEGAMKVRSVDQRSLSAEARPALQAADGLTVWAEPDGRLFFGRDGQPWGTVKPEIQKDGDVVPLEVAGVVDVTQDQQALTVRWVVAEAAVEIQLTGELTDDGLFRGHAQARNLDDEAKWVRMLLPFEYTAGHGPAVEQIAFQKRWILEMRPLVFPLSDLGIETRADFGTWIFGWGAHEGMVSDEMTGQLRSDDAATTDLYIPLICGYNERGGIAVFVNPRTAWGFAWAPQRQVLTRRFYLPAERDFVAAGFDDGAGDGEVPYEFYVHLTPSPDWGDLYNQAYLPQFPFLTAPAAVPLPAGAKTSFWEWDADDWEEQFDRVVKQAGIRYVHGRSTFKARGYGSEAPVFRREVLPERVAAVREKGVYQYLWTNIRMAPDVNMDSRYVDPEYQYANFRDALTRNQQGEIYQSWAGYSVNHAPEFSFGKYQLERLIEEIEALDMDGVFMDYYDDTVQVDWGKTYKHYPFYPLNVATIRFTRELVERLRERGKFFISNCPNPSLIVNQFSDAYAADPPSDDAAFWYRLALPGKPYIHLPIFSRNPAGHPRGEHFGADHMNSSVWHQAVLSRVHYGAVPALWSDRWGPLHGIRTAADPDTLLSLFSRNVAFWEKMANGHILGGGTDPYRELYHDLGDDRWALSFRNPSEKMMPIAFHVPRHFELDGEYGLLEWSLTDGSRVLVEAMSPSALAELEVKRFLQPHDARFFLLTPASDLPAVRKQLDVIGRP